MDKQEAFIIYLELKEAAEEIQVIEQTLKENCIDPISTKNLFSSNFNKMMEDLASNIKKLHSYIIVENDIELMKEVSLIPKHPFFFYPLHCERTLTDASELFSKIQAFLSEIRIEYEKLAKETNSNNSKHKEVKPEPQYSEELLDLFYGHEELINELIGKSDDEKAKLIRKWNKGKDGRPLIKNFKNRLRKEYATQLKQAGLISESIENFRKKLI